ncbi:RNA-binding domain-containing protein [Veillonella intestinalis]|uniref:RNA-binding domain-containing protein n=1 Tax=Veillonella intestinalis TaxID=2941341 RepID=UPI00203AB407|nr:RNA-binding domain-containing protein [Veillonella intestinalis]
MKDYKKIIIDLIENANEGEWFEFKENWYEPNQLGEYISALANAAAMCNKSYGYLIWGISDYNHDVVGTTFDFTIAVNGEPLEHFLARQLTPDTAFRFHEISFLNKRLVIMEVPRATKTPVSFKNNRFIRIGSSKVNLLKYPEREATLFEKLRRDGMSLKNMVAEYQDLQFTSLFNYYSGVGIKLNLDTFDVTLGLRTDDGQYNMLAQLLSDNSHIPIRVSVFSGNTKEAPLYMVKEFGNRCLLVSVTQILEYGDVLNIMQADERRRVAIRKDVPLFNSNAYREAIINAFVHNKWTDGNAPMISVLSDRIEILSRGTLAAKQTKEGFFNGASVPVNTELANIFLQLRVSERSGRGVPTIIDAYSRDVFTFSENTITVTLPFNRISTYQVSEPISLYGMNSYKNHIYNINSEKEELLKIKYKQGIETDEGKKFLHTISVLPLLNKTRLAILEHMARDPFITQKQLTELLSISIATVANNIAFLKANSYVTRIGPDRGGYWQVCQNPQNDVK